MGTGIQWTDETWNFLDGCTYESTGCRLCYARTWHDRIFLQWKRGQRPSAPKQYHLPFKVVQELPERLGKPLHWSKPRRVFVNSVSDAFHPLVSDDLLTQAFGVMALTPQHTFQILTKRPERMRDWLLNADQTAIKVAGMRHLEALTQRQRTRLQAKLARVWQWPLPNVWLGTTTENQETADQRIPFLLQTPAAVRFLSCEPLLGPVDLGPWLKLGWVCEFCHRRNHDRYLSHGWQFILQSAVCPDCAPRVMADGGYTIVPGGAYAAGTPDPRPWKPLLDWVIIGGESGEKARPMEEDWMRDLVQQCQAAGVATFVKQMGERYAKEHHTSERHAGIPEEWPEDLRIREYPTVAA